MAAVENHWIGALSQVKRRLARMLRVRRIELAAALTISALVVALGQVAHQAVRQGEIRRAATAAHTAAFWNCHSSQSRALRASCLAQLNPPTSAPSDEDATPSGQHIVAVDLGAPSGGH